MAYLARRTRPTVFDRDTHKLETVRTTGSTARTGLGTTRTRSTHQARKVLSPTNTMVQTDTWTAAGDGSWDGTVEVEVKGAPVKMSGTMRLEPDGDDTTMHLTLSMSVKVPLVGGKIADWAGKNDVPRTMAAEFGAGDAWLADHPA